MLKLLESGLNILLEVFFDFLLVPLWVLSALLGAHFDETKHIFNLYDHRLKFESIVIESNISHTDTSINISPTWPASKSKGSG